MGFEDRVEALLAAKIEGFRSLAACERLSGGASQETYRLAVETEAGAKVLAMRRAPGGERSSTITRETPGLRGEANLFAAARAAGVPEPEILHVFEEADGLGDGFLMEWLEGETLGARIVRSEEFGEIRPRLARQCGEILARIHAIDVEASGLSGALARRSPEALVHESWDLYKAYGTPQPMIDYTARWLLENLPEGDLPGLVHGDFRNGNLMVSPEEGVVGVLDWELAHLGDPIRDLGWLCTHSWRYGRPDLPVGGFGRTEDLLDGYVVASGRSVDPDHLHFWIVFGSFWWAVGCLSMAQMFRLGPDRSVERAAIGRRSSECQIDCVNLLIPGESDVPAPDARESSLEIPRADELVTAVGDFLRKEVMEKTDGRTRFLARVAANALDIVARELALAPEFRQRERAALEGLLGHSGDLEALRWELVEALRAGELALGEGRLEEYLRNTVATQVAIDQPRYSGSRR